MAKNSPLLNDGYPKDGLFTECPKTEGAPVRGWVSHAWPGRKGSAFCYNNLFYVLKKFELKYIFYSFFGRWNTGV
jgi:hypothetical protein